MYDGLWKEQAIYDGFQKEQLVYMTAFGKNMQFI